MTIWLTSIRLNRQSPDDFKYSKIISGAWFPQVRRFGCHLVPNRLDNSLDDYSFRKFEDYRKHMFTFHTPFIFGFIIIERSIDSELKMVNIPNPIWIPFWNWATRNVSKRIKNASIEAFELCNVMNRRHQCILRFDKHFNMNWWFECIKTLIRDCYTMAFHPIFYLFLFIIIFERLTTQIKWKCLPILYYLRNAPTNDKLIGLCGTESI